MSKIDKDKLNEIEYIMLEDENGDVNRHKYRKARIMAIVGGAVGLGALATAVAWPFMTMATVGQSMGSASAEVWKAAGITLGAGALVAAAARVKDFANKRYIRTVTEKFTGYKIKRKWGFKSYINRPVKRSEELNAEQQKVADEKYLKRVAGGRKPLSDEQIKKIEKVMGIASTTSTSKPSPKGKAKNPDMDTSRKTFNDNLAEYQVEPKDTAFAGARTVVLSMVSVKRDSKGDIDVANSTALVDKPAHCNTQAELDAWQWIFLKEAQGLSGWGEIALHMEKRNPGKSTEDKYITYKDATELKKAFTEFETKYPNAEDAITARPTPLTRAP